jgi:hypothetical protein
MNQLNSREPSETIQQELDLYDFTCSILKKEQLEQEVYSLGLMLEAEGLPREERIRLLALQDIAEAYLDEYEKIENAYAVYRQEEASYYGD